MSDDLTGHLENLQRDFTADRTVQQATAAVLSEILPTVCRYCGKSRQVLVGSITDGHVHCMVSDGFKLRLYDLLRENYRITYKVAGDAIGMTRQHVRAWYERAQKLRGMS